MIILKVNFLCFNGTRKPLLIHGFSPVNARLLTVYGTAFYAIILINELLIIVRSSGLGLCIFDINCTCPTFAGDIYLASLSKFGLDSLLAMCFNYYIRWRLICNALNCSVPILEEKLTDSVLIICKYAVITKQNSY